MVQHILITGRTPENEKETKGRPGSLKIAPPAASTRDFGEIFFGYGGLGTSVFFLGGASLMSHDFSIFFRGGSKVFLYKLLPFSSKKCIHDSFKSKPTIQNKPRASQLLRKHQNKTNDTLQLGISLLMLCLVGISTGTWRVFFLAHFLGGKLRACYRGFPDPQKTTCCKGHVGRISEVSHSSHVLGE